MGEEVYKIAGNDAATYEEHLGPLVFEPAAQALLSHISAFPVHAILETASGTGRLTKHLRKSFPAAESLVATDINPDMLEIAQQQLNDPSITFQLADAQQLPFPDQSFDLVVNQFGLMFLPDKEAGLKEAARVLKPGGHFVFTTWDKIPSMPLFTLLIEEVILPLFKDEDTTRFYTPFSLHDPQLLNTFLEQAGFRNHKVVFLKFSGRADSPQHIVNSYFLQHPLGRQVKEKAPDAFDKVAKELEHRLTKEFGAGAFKFELRALAGMGRK